MRIGSSTIGMESERTYSSTVGRISKLTIADKGQGMMEGTGNLFGSLLQGEEGKSGNAREQQGDYLYQTMEEMNAKAEVFRRGRIRTPELTETARQLRSIRQQCLDYLMNILFPERRAVRYLGDGTSGSTVTVSEQYCYEETENTTFSTQGTVTCADGRKIDFSLNLEMSRSFQEYYEESYTLEEVSLCDPLVINLDGNIAELSDQTFFFDIDADGEKDEISRLASGSGYLALDKNGDGMINDGSELFGTRSGNGFADLAAYDSDRNGFIDEGDEIWNKLKIWMMDETGKPQLVSLADKGVGAVCLSSAPSDFSLTGEDNTLRGKIRRTGFFLYESGAAGSVQHVDLVKYHQAG